MASQQLLNDELKRQVKYLSKKLNAQEIRSHLSKTMPKSNVLRKSV